MGWELVVGEGDTHVHWRDIFRALVVRWWIIGALMVHWWSTGGTLVVHWWDTGGPLVVHWWYTGGCSGQRDVGLARQSL
jgi:hypothetical protein